MTAQRSDVELDVVIIGGGIQGLLALDALVERGFACALVSDGDLGSGQTLHSHGVLNAGFGFLGPDLPRALADVVEPDLRERGLDLGSEWVLIPPPNFPGLEHLPAATLPPGFAAPAGAVTPPERNFPKRQLVEALSEGLQDRVLVGHAEPIRGGQRVETVTVRLSATGEEVVLGARAVVIAAGCGSKRLLEGLAGPTPQTEQIKHRRVHMICVRAPSGSLPTTSVSAMPLGVMLVAHDQPEHVTWYATPMEFGGPAYDDVPPDAASEVDPETIVRGCQALLGLYPGLPDVEELQIGCYAGYRQDVGDMPGTRLCELVEGTANVIIALPSGLVGPWLNVIAVTELLAGLVDPDGSQPPLPSGGIGVRVGSAVEDRPDFAWMSWTDWVRAYPQLAGPR